ncbi:MAG: hypothetical protein Q8873_06205 [Bacillota bacterium]|nr:hypothetical protein [Bacillota bacterium]
MAKRIAPAIFSPCGCAACGRNADAHNYIITCRYAIITASGYYMAKRIAPAIFSPCGCAACGRNADAHNYIITCRYAIITASGYYISKRGCFKYIYERLCSYGGF